MGAMLLFPSSTLLISKNTSSFDIILFYYSMVLFNFILTFFSFEQFRIEVHSAGQTHRSHDLFAQRLNHFSSIVPLCCPIESPIMSSNIEKYLFFRYHSLLLLNGLQSQAIVWLRLLQQSTNLHRFFENLQFP